MAISVKRSRRAIPMPVRRNARVRRDFVITHLPHVVQRIQHDADPLQAEQTTPPSECQHYLTSRVQKHLGACMQTHSSSDARV